MKYYLGIDIGGTHIKGGIVNLLTNDIHQNILSHEELNATDSTSSIITKVRKVITDIQACMPLSKLGGIGIAMSLRLCQRYSCHLWCAKVSVTFRS